MKQANGIRAQFRSVRPTLALIALISAFLLGVVVFLHYWKELPIVALTSDPLSVAGMPIYLGFLSQIGIFIWAATAAICLFTAFVLTSGKSDIPHLNRFLILAGLLTLWLGLDDVFILHEKFFPKIGVPQDLVLGVYAGLALIWTIRFRETIAKTEYVLLGMALAFLGASVAQDIFSPEYASLHLFEDGAKLIGLLSWLAYFVRLCFSEVRLNVAQQAPK